MMARLGPLLFAALGSATNAQQPQAPRLPLDSAVLNDEIVVWGAEPGAMLQIKETIYSPPVSLAKLTDGLVQGSTSEAAVPSAARQSEKELDRATRALQVGH